MDIKQALNTLEEADVKVVQEEGQADKFVDHLNKDYEFSTAVDKVGLPVEHVGYADRNCRLCYGRGVQRLVVADNSVGEVYDAPYRRARGGGAEPVRAQVKNPNRRNVPCGCMNAGYTRFRKAYEAAPADQQVKMLEKLRARG